MASHKAVIKWKGRCRLPICQLAPEAQVNVVSFEDEAIIVAFCKYTLLALDNCRYALQASHHASHPLVLSSLPSTFGISRLPEVQDGKGIKRKFKAYPIGY